MRTTVVAVLALSLGLALGCTLLVQALRSELVNQLDDAALTRAADARAALARGDLAAAVSRAGGESSSLQVLSPAGTVLARSPGLPAEAVTAAPGPPRDLQLLHHEYRLVTRRAGTDVIAVLTPLDDVEEATRRLVVLLLLAAPVLVAAVGAANWLLVGYALGTVDRLRSQVATLSAQDLSHRVELPASQDEVRQLAETMNDLLERLQAASAAQRRFVADAAHELRSPLAAVRTRIEVNGRLRDLTAWQDAVPGLLQGTDRLAALVEDLLALARLDEERTLRHTEPVDLDELVFQAVQPLRGVGAVEVDSSGVGAGLVRGDADLLRRVVGNLLTNAVRHARQHVRVELLTKDREVHLVVADDGPGIAAPDHDRVFQRFVRLDDARARDSGGSGLGLAIVHDAVQAHGGRVWVEDGAPGASLHVVLPQDLRPDAPDPTLQAAFRRPT